LVPASYLEITEDDMPNIQEATPTRPDSSVSMVSITTTSSSGGQAAAQKRELLGVLDKFGFPERKKSTVNAVVCGPQDIEYYPVTVIFNYNIVHR
jgi:hypothetical protein